MRLRSSGWPALSARRCRKLSCARPFPSLKGWIAFSSARKSAAPAANSSNCLSARNEPRRRLSKTRFISRGMFSGKQNQFPSAGPPVDILKQVPMHRAVVSRSKPASRKRLFRPQGRHLHFERREHRSIPGLQSILEYGRAIIGVRVVEGIVAPDRHLRPSASLYARRTALRRWAGLIPLALRAASRFLLAALRFKPSTAAIAEKILAPSTRDPPLAFDFRVLTDISALYRCPSGHARKS